jgi:hypothetical protein
MTAFLGIVSWLTVSLLLGLAVGRVCAIAGRCE